MNMWRFTRGDMQRRYKLGEALFAMSLITASAQHITAPVVHHVSSSSGDDRTGDGSAAAPWRTLSFAGRQLTAGGLLLLERNNTWWDESLHIASAVNVTIGAYGATALPLPLIQLGRATSVEVTCIQLGRATRVHISDIHVSGCSVGLSIEAARGAANVSVQRMFFRDLRTPFARYSPALPDWATAISMSGAEVTNLTVSHNVAVRVDSMFRGAQSSGLLISGNTVQQCSGNCYSLGSGAGMVMRDNVMLRDLSTRYFLYGTTDVIVGTLKGDNRLVDNDFNARGEYTGGPDGCAFDFETSASGFVIEGNTFYRSWGAGVMVFGHATTSHGIAIRDNVFAMDGCDQPRDDKGGIALMCPNGHKPSGAIESNAFYSCGNGSTVPAIFVNPAVPGCADNMSMVNNTIDNGAPLVAMPAITVNPPPPTSKATSGTLDVRALTRSPNATLRYTLDGSRPTERSPILPATGLRLKWPGPAVAFNARAFKAGSRPSVTNGAVLELDYILGREAHVPSKPHAAGVLDGVFHLSAEPAIRGWAVDTALPRGGLRPVAVQVSVDSYPVSAVLAAARRPDLVPAGVAPNAEHGFNCTLPPEVAVRLQHGKHTIDVHVIGSPSSEQPWPLEGSPICVCDGLICGC